MGEGFRAGKLVCWQELHSVDQGITVGILSAEMDFAGFGQIPGKERPKLVVAVGNWPLFCRFGPVNDPKQGFGRAIMSGRGWTELAKPPCELNWPGVSLVPRSNPGHALFFKRFYIGILKRSLNAQRSTTVIPRTVLSRGSW